MTLLKIENLEVAYGAITALHGISLEVRVGEVVTLIGSNGAGKTTLLRTISGLLRPRAGQVVLTGGNGNPNHGEGPYVLSRLTPDEIVRLGVSHSPEGRQVFPHMTVRENLQLGAYQRRDRRAIADDIDQCYHLFPILRERMNQKSGTLSGGEQQMLAMGRALMARPRLLLLDEPSLGLAPLVVRKIFQIIRDLRAGTTGSMGAGTTIFLVEQNAHMALGVADRAYVLQTGRLIKEGDAKSLLADPAVKEAYLGG